MCLSKLVLWRWYSCVWSAVKDKDSLSFCQRCLGLAVVPFYELFSFLVSFLCVFCDLLLYHLKYISTLLYPIPLLLFFCLFLFPSTPSPVPGESPYLSAVCLTYLSLLWNIKESAASSPEGSPQLLLTTHIHAHAHIKLKSQCLLKMPHTALCTSYPSFYRLLLVFRDWCAE